MRVVKTKWRVAKKFESGKGKIVGGEGEIEGVEVKIEGNEGIRGW